MGRASTESTRARPRRKKSGAPTGHDLEGIGLVCSAFGVAILAALVPAFPSGAIGASVRTFLTHPIGWGAWLLPWPLVAVGALLLARRRVTFLPRALAGYATLGLGAWSLLMLLAPERAGAWGVLLRSLLTGSAGALALVPALLLLPFGAELLLGRRPGSLPIAALRATGRAVRATAMAFMRFRARVRARAAFGADVARVRRELRELALDLTALRAQYPGSAELDAWRASVHAAKASLRRAGAGELDAARADVAAWRAAVGDFARDRARELIATLRTEVAHPPRAVGDVRRGEDFDAWGREQKALLDPPLGAAPRGFRAAAALDAIRRALVLDGAALQDRHRRLQRERDLAEAALANARPRDLAEVAAAHTRRQADLRSLETAAAAAAEATAAFAPWRALHADLVATATEFPDEPQLAAWDAALAERLRERGRAELPEHAHHARDLAELDQRLRFPPTPPLPADLTFAADDGFPPADGGASESGSVDATPLDRDGADETDRANHPHSVAGGAVGAMLLGPGDFAADPDRRGGPRRSVPERRQAPAPDVATPDRGAPPSAEAFPLPSLDLLDPPEPPSDDPQRLDREQRDRTRKIDATLSSFKLEGRVVASVRGPTVTRFEVEPAQGEKISRFANLSDDLALAMAVASVRIEAPIPGKSVIGLEVPNTTKDLIRFREAVEAPAFRHTRARLPLLLGKSIDGEMMVGDLARMPHLLIAGSTGSGKSIAVNTLVASLLYRFLPTELRFLMIDPKMVELTPFDGVPHLIRPVVTNPAEAAGVLLGAVAHMERRYKMMSRIGVKNLDQYAAKAKNLDLPELPYVVIVIDELADLMITSPKEVEGAIMRLAQMARATGMHLILATQRPSVDILTSLIKVNVPARMAFAVSSGFDSRTILDTMGAERLLGRGDMLYHQPGLPKPLRLQGPFVAETEIAAIGDFLRGQVFEDEFVEAYGSDFEPALPDDSTASGFIDWNDEKLRAAAELVITEGEASVSRLQRRLQVGHARAGKLMDSLENLGVVGPHARSKPREVLVTLEELPNIFGK